MRPVSVVVSHVFGQHPFELTSMEDQRSILTLATNGPHEARGERNGLWRPDRRRVTRIPSDRKTSSNCCVNLVSRSRTGNLTG